MTANVRFCVSHKN